MIIVCTQDPAVRNNTAGASAWGAFKLLTTGSSQSSATAQLNTAIVQLGQHEALCLSAHGNNTEIGDPDPSGWTWTTSQIASSLQQQLPLGYDGAILISACASNIVNFSANLAQELRNNGWRLGLWIYGYNKALGSSETYPDPAKLDKNVSLQGTKV